MKKFIIGVLMLVSMSLIPYQISAETSKEISSASVDKANEEAKAMQLIDRLYEMRGIDVSKLNSSEKITLRKEVRSIHDQLKMISGGLYISFGVIILILLLIILI